MIASNQRQFSLGQIVATPGVLAVLEENKETPMTYLARHARCDWGDVCREDWESNDKALDHGSRLFSSYELGDDKLWIITEADRSATTLLTPEEY